MRAQARRLGEHLSANRDLGTVDVGYSLVVSRAEFECRAVVLGDNREELLGGLGMLSAGEPATQVVEGATSSANPEGGVAFVFPGQGSQWEGMALGLLDASPVFSKWMHECADALGEYVDWSLLDVLRGSGNAPKLDTIDVLQPALFAVMVSLAELWRACGVRPAAVIGHSQGEIAAACVAGALSLDDAARVVALRSRALRALAGRGGMLAIETAFECARESRVVRWPRLGCGGEWSSLGRGLGRAERFGGAG